MSLIGTMLESSGALYRPHIGRDANQGVTQTFQLVQSGFACSIQQLSSRDVALYAQRGMEGDTVIYFAFDPGAQVNDIFLGTDRSGNTTTYQAVGKSEPVGRARLWNLAVKQRQPIAAITSLNLE